jgi:hypothetical protein
VSKRGSVFLDGISSFWTRFFGDKEILDDLYEGSLESLSKSYQTLLMSLTRHSVEDTPLTEREAWKSLVLYESDLFHLTGPGGTQYLWRLPDAVREVSLLHNVPIRPTATLERDFDFELVANDQERLEELRDINARVPASGWFLLFNEDLFNVADITTGILGPKPGFSLGREQFDMPLAVEGTSPAFDFYSKGISTTDTVKILYTSGKIALVSPVSGSRSYLDRYQNPTNHYKRLYVSLRGEVLPSEGEVASISVGTNEPFYNNVLATTPAKVVRGVGTIRALSLWAPSAQVDHYTLYNHFGFSFSADPKESTPEYRAFVQGMWSLFVRGFTLGRVESALNVLSDLPVARYGTIGSDTEEVLSVAYAAAAPGVTTVTTSAGATYTLPYGVPLKAEVLLSSESLNGVERVGQLTVFADSGVPSFLALGISAGDTLDVLNAVDNTIVDATYLISFVWDTFLEVANATPFPVAASGQEWRVTHSGDTLASGVLGVSIANSPSTHALEHLEALSSAFVVVDGSTSPGWWGSRTVVPPALARGESRLRREVSSVSYANLLGLPADQHVGDLGGVVGKNDDDSEQPSLALVYLTDPGADFSAGIVVGSAVTITIYANPADLANSASYEVVDTVVSIPGPRCLELTGVGTVADPDTYGIAPYATYTVDGGVQQGVSLGGRAWANVHRDPGSRHSLAYLLFSRFYRNHTFAVFVNAAEVALPVDWGTLYQHILKAKPAHLYPYVESEAALRDLMGAQSDTSVGVVARVATTEQLTGLDTILRVGARPPSLFEAAGLALPTTTPARGGMVLVLANYGGVAYAGYAVLWASQFTRGAVSHQRIYVDNDGLQLSATGLTWSVYVGGTVEEAVTDAAAGAPSPDYSGNAGSVLGVAAGVGGLLVGGEDPWVDRHELYLCHDQGIVYGATPDYSSHVMGAPSTYTSTYVGSDGISHVHPYSVQGMIPSLVVTPGIIHIADEAVALRTIP